MSKFVVYTYQFYRIFRSSAAELFPDDVNPDESFEKRHELFDTILDESGRLVFKQGGRHQGRDKGKRQKPERQYGGRVVMKERDVFIGKIGKHGLLSYFGPNFEHGKIDNYPNHTFIVANNEATSQILIQNVERGFSSTDDVARVLEDTFNSKLAPFRLYMEIRPRYLNDDFYNFVEKNIGDIASITFKLAEPNNPWISNSIDEMANDMAKQTHSDFSFQLSARKDETMVINRTYEALSALVDASTKAGYPIIVTTKNHQRHECGKMASYRFTVDIEEKCLKGIENGDLLHLHMDEIKATLRNIALQV